MATECDDPKCGCHQLAWLELMERIEQEVFPDARPRSEVLVDPPGGYDSEGMRGTRFNPGDGSKADHP